MGLAGRFSLPGWTETEPPVWFGRGLSSKHDWRFLVKGCGVIGCRKHIHACNPGARSLFFSEKDQKWYRRSSPYPFCWEMTKKGTGAARCTVFLGKQAKVVQFLRVHQERYPCCLGCLGCVFFMPISFFDRWDTIEKHKNSKRSKSIF